MDKENSAHHYEDVIDLKKLISKKTGLNVKQCRSFASYVVTLTYSDEVKE